MLYLRFDLFERRKQIKDECKCRTLQGQKIDDEMDTLQRRREGRVKSVLIIDPGKQTGFQLLLFSLHHKKF